MVSRQMAAIVEVKPCTDISPAGGGATSARARWAHGRFDSRGHKRQQFQANLLDNFRDNTRQTPHIIETSGPVFWTRAAATVTGEGPANGLPTLRVVPPLGGAKMWVCRSQTKLVKNVQSGQSSRNNVGISGLIRR